MQGALGFLKYPFICKFTKGSSSEFFLIGKIWQKYGHESAAPLVWLTLYLYLITEAPRWAYEQLVQNR